MKKNTKKSRNFLFIISTFIMFLLMLNCNMKIASSNITQPIYETSNLSYTVFSPIIIDSNDDFETYGFSGEGNSSHPYIIEDYSIDTTGTYGINITSVTSHFIIRDCLITSSGIAIYIKNTSPGTVTIYKNICNNNGDCGIYVESSGTCTIANNTCNNNGPGYNFNIGIYIVSCSSSLIANNTCDNNQVGIYSSSSLGSTIIDNSCSMNGDLGIYVTYSQSSFIANNYLSNKGLAVLYSQSTFILQNTMVNCGFQISEFESDYDSYTITDNYVNSKPLGYFSGQNDLYFDNEDFGQIIIADCSNVTLKNILISNTDIGISIFSSSKINLIENILDQNNLNGIYMVNSYQCNITDSIFNDNGLDGIGLYLVYETIIEGCVCENNGYAGIMVSFSDYVNVKNNELNQNTGYGAYLGYSSYISFLDNMCDSNNVGLIIDGTETSTITYNVFYSNPEYGVRIESGSSFNTLHHNTFTYNGYPTSQAYDDGTNNVWYDTTANEGNTWSDLGSAQTYPIDGSAGCVDLYPLNVGIIPEFSEITLSLFILSIIGITYVALVQKQKRRMK